MTKKEVKLQAKLTALNKIRLIFNPKYEFTYFQWTDQSYPEQRESYIRRVIEEMEKELASIKHNPKLKE